MSASGPSVSVRSPNPPYHGGHKPGKFTQFAKLWRKQPPVGAYSLFPMQIATSEMSAEVRTNAPITDSLYAHGRYKIVLWNDDEFGGGTITWHAGIYTMFTDLNPPFGASTVEGDIPAGLLFNYRFIPVNNLWSIDKAAVISVASMKVTLTT